MIRPASVLGTLVAVAALAVSVPITQALLTDTSAASATFGTATVRPPTGLTGSGGSTVALNWTPTVTTQAAGYHVLRSATSGSGYTQVKTVTPTSAATTTDSPTSGTWYYVLQTYAGGWTSASSNEASVLVSTQRTTATTGCDPTLQAAVTSGAGDNNGYELNPGNACAQGGGYATDASSGTDNVNSCTDTGKDRHRFWGYSFGLPGTVTAVNGVTVTAIAGQSNSGGVSSICLQLSWDGGATWTTPRQTSLTASSLTTYTVGSASDTWGHAWTATQLGSSTFRIRVTDVATVSNKDFRLDFLGASVTYAP